MTNRMLNAEIGIIVLVRSGFPVLVVDSAKWSALERIHRQLRVQPDRRVWAKEQGG
jgi:hypothetical protein